MKRTASFVTLFALSFSGAAAATPITNASFDTTTPAVAAGTCVIFTPGSAGVTGWTVVGNAGTDVAVCSTGYVQSGISFVGEDGPNWLDLTGLTSNSDTEGVQQSIATIVGDSYTLSFFLGNVDNPAAGFGVTSTVDIFANGTSLGAFTNSCTTCTTTQGWQQFSVTFTATSASTTLLFRNGDPVNDNTNGLENLVLTDNGPAASPVPEPGTVTMLGSGLLGLCAAVRKKMKMTGNPIRCSYVSRRC